MWQSEVMWVAGSGGAQLAVCLACTKPSAGFPGNAVNWTWRSTPGIPAHGRGWKIRFSITFSYIMSSRTVCGTHDLL